MQQHLGGAITEDDTFLNAIRLRCSDGSVLKSSESPHGSWLQEKTISPNSYFKGAKIRQEQFLVLPGIDDTGANGLKMYTKTNREISPGDGKWGEWSTTVYCPGDTKIVGFKTRNEIDKEGLTILEWDNTALNDVMFKCL